MPMRRPERVAAQITREASEIIKFTLADPQIRLVTVNRSHVSPDLRHATVFVTVLGDAQQCLESLGALQRAARVVRRELSARLRLRYSPEVTFQLDPEMVTEEGVRQTLGDRGDDTNDDLEIIAPQYE